MDSILRDQSWLENRLNVVWKRGFSEMEAINRVEICYGRVARTRLGSIRMSRDRKVSKILMNRLFQKEEVPIEVIDATIAHELVHYLHGFSSPFEQKFSTPHAGGVVTKELKARGFARELSFQKRWIKSFWPAFLKQYGAARNPRSRGIRRLRVKGSPRSVWRRLVKVLH